jgi:UDP-N-acetylmuramate dehydrogenase
MMSLEELREHICGEVTRNQNLAKFSSFRIGGNAEIFVVPTDKEDALRAVAFFEKKLIPYLVLGRGSNVLISDAGIKGAVISLRENLEKIEVQTSAHQAAADEAIVYAEAGVDLPMLASQMLKQSLGGLENLSGVPGSLGGAILMNAGAYGKEIFEVIEWVEVIRNGKLVRLQKQDIAYRYRATDLEKDVIVACELRLKKLSPVELEAASKNRKAWMEKRRTTQPLNLPNAGSIFKNPPPDAHGKPRFTGELIEACGLKGMKIGGAQISEKHANFIVNRDDAKAADVLELIEMAQHHVKEKFDIDLELEIKLLGFEKQMVASAHASYTHTKVV